MSINHAGEFLQSEEQSFFYQLLRVFSLVHTSVLGPDISFYQDLNSTTRKVDFEKMKAAGAKFVICRAGQNSWPDPDFADYWRDAKAAGIPRGSYWFYDSRYPPESQADLWLSILGADRGELPMWADLEESYGGSYSGAVNWRKFIERVQLKVPGKEIGVYTAYGYWSAKCPVLAQPWFGQFPLWVANYGVTTPKLPPGWSDWLFWQWTSTGNGPAYGVESLGIDLNYFNGDLATFQQRFGGEPVIDPPPPPPETGDLTMTSVTYSNGVQLYTGRLNGHSDFELKIIPPASIDRAGMFKPDGCRLAENVIGDKDLAFNWAPFYSPCVPNRGVRVNGIEYQIYDGLLQGSYAPFFWWDSANVLHMDHRKTVWKTLMSAMQGFRYVIEAGIKNPRYNSDWSNVNPQRVLGRKPDGSTVLLSVCGRGYRDSQGATLHEVAELLLQFGCDYAIDGDGGGSIRDALRIDDQVQVFQGTSENRGAPAGGVIKFKEPIVGTIPEPPIDPDPPTPGNVAFWFDVDGYKPVSGYLEPDDVA